VLGLRRRSTPDNADAIPSEDAARDRIASYA